MEFRHGREWVCTMGHAAVLRRGKGSGAGCTMGSDSARRACLIVGNAKQELAMYRLGNGPRARPPTATVAHWVCELQGYYYHKSVFTCSENTGEKVNGR